MDGAHTRLTPLVGHRTLEEQTYQYLREAITLAALDATSLREVYAVRHALEDLIMRAAAAHVTDDALRALRDTQVRLLHHSVTGDLPEYRKAERAFHIGVYDAANMPLTAAILTDLWDRVEPYRGRRYISTGLMNANHDEHTAILDALERHDAQCAVEAMHHHVATGFSRFLEALKASGS
ncbi:MAG: GntR family transcriptional regulator [Thermomicrobia bacterium]|nr:GntR family transcriptional regulator [Thermomicrobia bacterium]